MKHLHPILLFILFLVGCGNGETAVTPPIVPAHTATAAPTSVPTGTLPPTVDTPAQEPEAPTAVPTDTPPATETALPLQPVEHIQLLPLAAEGLRLTIYLTHAGDERLFVVQQDGVIWIIAGGATLAQPFLDIRDRVGAQANEQGLLSVAFHPSYAANGYFYVNYTDREGSTTISRFQVTPDNPDTADPASEQILLTIRQPYGNHNGGLVKFGPDGYLYIGMGDGGSSGDPHNHGQNAGTLLGSLLRIDVNVADAPYGIPASNPFVGDDSKGAEIWATGLRNPWRFSFDRETGDLYITDVGQNQWEEVNFQAADSSGGENYGWNILEGSHCYGQSACDTAGLTPPIFEYDHSQGCSISGGYVYRGAQFPEMQGNYFVADFCTGYVWRLFPQPDGRWHSALILQSGLDIASFGEDVNGELYVVARNGGVFAIRP